MSLFAFAPNTCLGSEVHDIAITDVTVAFPIIPWWSVTSILVTVENLGTVSETVQVAIHARNSKNLSMGSYTIQNLAPGDNDTMLWFWGPYEGLVIFEIFPPPWPWWDRPLAENFTVWAEAEVVPGEVNVSNNVYVDGNLTIIWWVLDVYPPDGKIDISDVASVGMSFGSYPGHPYWNPYVDFNSDEKINIEDLAASGIHFGETY